MIIHSDTHCVHSIIRSTTHLIISKNFGKKGRDLNWVSPMDHKVVPFSNSSTFNQLKL